MSENVKQAIPFFGVSDMNASLRFYTDGLGFQLKRKWVPETDAHYPSNGSIRWCWLELGNAAIMLQEFAPQSRPRDALGIGASVSFQCEDALALYREFQSRGVRTATRPFVGNGLWVVPLTDPDGYRIDFSSPTDAPEGSESLDAHISSAADDSFSPLAGASSLRMTSSRRPFLANSRREQGDKPAKELLF